jgi:predicted Zn-dependent protease
MSGFFYNLGRRLGRQAVPAVRKSKWVWDGLTGTEEEALKAEASLGRALAVELRSVTPPVTDPVACSLARDLCGRLAARARNRARVFQCEIVEDSTLNAVALPGGFIFVSNALVELCNGLPEELAFVIGHEMAHVIRGHTWDRMINDTALSLASSITSRAGPLGSWLNQKGFALLRSAHSRDAETEADELGLRLAAAAGFQPEGAIELLQRIGRLSQRPPGPGQYFASHPAPADRIARLWPLVRQLGGGAGDRPSGREVSQ